MAGESPGRAGQQESSGETTGRKAVDPRLSVFHGPGALDVSDGPGGSDGVDGAERQGREAGPEAGRAAAEADDVRRTSSGPSAAPRTPAATNAVGEVAPGTAGNASAWGGKSEKTPSGDAPRSTPAAGGVPDAAGPQSAADKAAEGPRRASAGAVGAVPGSDATGAPGGASESAAGAAGAAGAKVAMGNSGTMGTAGAGVTVEAVTGAASDKDAVRPPQDAADGTASPGAAPAVQGPRGSVAPGSGPTAGDPAGSGPAVPRADSAALPPKEPAAAADRTAVTTAGGTAPAAPPAPPPPPREQTRQMPLPPAPAEPLKLLAALTNTPPPPETPLRTAVRRVKIWTPLVLLLLVVFGTVQLLRPLPAPALTLTAASSYTFEGEAPALPWPSEGQAAVEVDGLGSLGSSGEEKPVPIASVAKVMTAYLLLREHPMKEGADGAAIPVDQAAEDHYISGLPADESVVKVTAGQKLSEYEALEHILISSANNVARLVARWDAGSEEEFVRKMNAAAEDLGMKNTTYTDPSGLDDTTVSTAKDQVKLGKAAMEDPVFREIATKIEYTASDGSVYRNWNQLAGYDGVVGIKTGTTTKAGGNLLFAAVQEVDGTEQMIIGAMLGQHTPTILNTVLTRSKELIVATQELLTSDPVIAKGDVVGYVDDGLGSRTPVVVAEDVTAVGWPGLEVDIAAKPGKGGVPREATAGTEVGTLTVGSGPGQVKVPVELRSDLTEPSLGARLARVA